MTRARTHAGSATRWPRIARTIVARLEALRERMADWRLRRRRLRDLERIFG